MMETTIGQLLVNDALPEKYRDYNRVMTKDVVDDVLGQLMRADPEKYKDISHKLVQLGRHASFEEGTTLKLSTLTPPFDKREFLDHVAKQERRIAQDKTLTPDEKEQARLAIYGDMQKFLTDETYKQALEQGNPFALQVKSKARGAPTQLTAILTTPSVYQDAHDRTIPVFIRRSYSEGLEPHEYWAAMYGARKATISTKFATRDAGALGKQLGVAVSSLVVTQDDCGTPYGIPVKADDKDNLGTVLARGMAGFPAGTVVDKNVLAAAKKHNIDNLVVRSPITCNLPEGVCKRCVGIRDNGNFPEIGHHIGLNAASALAEQLAQSQLNQKHCLFSDTAVLMGDWSCKSIKDIAIGDIVMGCDHAGVMRQVNVLNVFDNGERDCFRTVFKRNGAHRSSNSEVFELISTLEHKIWASRTVSNHSEQHLNFVPRLIPVGQKSEHFYAELPVLFDDTGLTDEPLALLIGNLLGDGCYTHSVCGVHLSSADNLQIDSLTSYLKPLGLKLQKLTGHKYYYRVSTVEESYPDAFGNPVKNFLINNGMYGKYAHEKELPPVVSRWSNKSVAELLGGIFTTDGSVYLSDGECKPGISLKSTSAVLLYQASWLLRMRFGIHTSNITRTSVAGTFNYRHDAYAFTITRINDVQRFASNIPLLGAKYYKLQDYLAQYVDNTRSRHHIGFRRISQEFVGVLPTHDIEIDHPDHMFVLANGLVVSNSGGQSHGGKAVYSGFDVINSLAQIPKTFPNRASVAENDGKITLIEAAPQGGTNIFVNDESHYVSPGMVVQVKEGDYVEQGDQLSDGIVNPADAVKYKGIGEGRRYFAERFTQAFRDSKLGVNRRNVEALARAAVDHVAVNEPEGIGAYLPGDVVKYNALAYTYKPRKDAKMLEPKKAVGQYLESPVLHYTIGTRVTKKMADQLKQFDVGSIMTHPQPVGFIPNMVSLTKVPQYENDWMARLGSSYLETRLLQDVHRGAESHVHGLNPLPGIAKGTEFGRPVGKEFTY